MLAPPPRSILTFVPFLFSSFFNAILSFTRSIVLLSPSKQSLSPAYSPSSHSLPFPSFPPALFLHYPILFLLYFLLLTSSLPLSLPLMSFIYPSLYFPILYSMYFNPCFFLLLSPIHILLSIPFSFMESFTFFFYFIPLRSYLPLVLFPPLSYAHLFLPLFLYLFLLFPLTFT